MINSRDINTLHPRVKKMALDFIHECNKWNIDLIVTSTYRDIESQNALYAQGRSLPGPKVTNAKGG
jgi:peptidoglycan L-alanyl-D-glutamate endopeptidase CwlK